MSTSAAVPDLRHRTAVAVAVMVAMSILLFTSDATGAGPYVFLVIALMVAIYGYLRSRLLRPWDGNDEPY